jgi:hypothetical protein
MTVTLGRREKLPLQCWWSQMKHGELFPASKMMIHLQYNCPKVRVGQYRRTDCSEAHSVCDNSERYVASGKLVSGLLAGPVGLGSAWSETRPEGSSLKGAAHADRLFMMNTFVLF